MSKGSIIKRKFRHLKKA